MRDYNSVFEGIDKTRIEIENELHYFEQINKENRAELEKAKRTNRRMEIVGIISLALSLISLLATIIIRVS